jgi:metal-responsive CopG/Arc/MetJ family transcriptional regulator
MAETRTLSIELDPELLSALDKFIAKQERPLTRDQALRMILMDALVTYGIAPLDVPPPVKPKDAH